MKALPHSAERDAAIERLLPFVRDHGWTWGATRRGGIEPGLDFAGTHSDTFPGGSPEMIEAFCDLADRRMLEAAERLCPDLRPSQRLRATLALRLAQNRPHRSAIRRAAAVMALPGRRTLATRCTLRTVDALWAAGGDRRVDFSWYTKRATLALVYSATLVFWLQDDDPTDAPTLAFFDRRVAGLRAVGRLRARVQGVR